MSGPRLPDGFELVEKPPSVRLPSGFELVITPPANANGEEFLSVGDVPRSFAAGLGEAVVGLPGLIADIPAYAQKGVDYVQKNWGSGKVQEPVIGTREGLAEFQKKHGGQAYIDSAKPYLPGLDYKTQTGAGEIARTAGHMAPNALVPGSAMARLAQVAVPTLTSEGGGKVGEAVGGQTGKAVGKGVGALLGAGGTAVAFRAPYMERQVGNAAGAVTRAQYDDAVRLVEDARNRGVELTVAEAIQAVAPQAKGLGTMQRIAESAARPDNALARLYADRPQAMTRATDTALDRVAPRPVDPSVQGVRAKKAAEEAIKGAQAGVNATTAYPYWMMQGDRVPAAQMRLLSTDPLFQKVLRDTRADDSLNYSIRHLPDDSVGVVDLVRQRMRELGEGAQSIGQATPSNLIAKNYGTAQGVTEPALDAATAGGNQLVRNIQSDLRRTQVEPLTAGPAGAISRTDDIGEQGRALMGPGASPVEVQRAASVIMAQDTNAGRAVVRENLGRAADKTVAGLDSAGQADQYGGAKFARYMRGDRGARDNISAAIETTGGGAARADINRLVDALQATGNRQRPGSMTTFNNEVVGDAKRSALVDILTKPLNPLATFQEKYGRFRLGNRMDDLADLLASGPEGVREVQSLAIRGTDRQRMMAQMLLSEKAALEARE
jgi:hypothetical protein